MPGLNLSSLASSPATFTTTAPKFGTHCRSGGVAFGSRNCVPDYPMTASCWVKRTSTGGTTARVAFGKNSSFWIGFKGDLASAAYGSTSGGFLDSSISVSDGNWHHLAIIITATGGTLFIDGVVGAVSSTTPEAANYVLYTSGGNAQSANRLGIGAFGDGTSPSDASVAIDQCDIYNAAIYATGTVGSTSFTVPSAATAPNASNLLVSFTLDNVLTNAATNRVSVLPNNTNIVYSPFNWAEKSSSQAKTTTPGAYLRMWFTGSTAVVNLDTTGLNANLSTVRWRMDDGQWNYTVNQAQIVCAAADNFNDSISHFLEFQLSGNSQTQNWWSPPTVGIQITGVTIDLGRTMLPATRKPGNIAFFSDSIATVGTYALNGISSFGGSGANDPSNSASGIAYGHMLSEATGKEFGMIGTPGTGWLFPASPAGAMALPNFAGSYNFHYSGVSRDFTEFPCDLVMIAHGQNDSSVTAAQITTQLNTLMSTPGLTTAKFIVFTPLASAKSVIRDRIIAAVAASSNPSRITTKVCDTFMDDAKTYDGVHPFANMHKEVFNNTIGTVQAVLAASGSGGGSNPGLNGKGGFNT